MSVRVIQRAPLPAAPARGVDANVMRVARIGIPASVVALAGVLRLTNLAAVTPNPYYDAAVRTMSRSWHDFLFGVFAPGSGLAIDKPPVDLWLQVASTKVFGFTTPALLLPQAIAGTLGVLLLFELLRTLFGWTAGVVGALALAVLPVAVITSRSDTMDSVMCALLLGAAVLIARAGRPGARRWPMLLTAAGLCGLAFEVKLVESLIALPPLLALFWLASEDRPPARMRQLAAMAAVFTVVALSWLTVVSIAPSSSRPWYIGSTNGSAWDATFVFNGVHRVAGPPTHRIPAPTARTIPRSQAGQRQRTVTTSRWRRDHAAALLRRPAAAGPVRLLARNASLNVRLGVELVAAWLVLLAALALGSWRRLDHLGRAGLVALGGWLAIGTFLFSVMHRLQPRYFEAFTPAVAGVFGAGLVLAAAALTRRKGERSRLAATATAAVVVAVLAVPAAASIGAVAHGTSDSGHPGHMATARVTALSAFLRAHQGSARYEVASLSAAKVAPLVVRDAQPVMILTSLYGQPLVPVSRFAAAVRSGQVRYALAGANCTRGSGDRLTGCSAQARWIRAHGTDVSRQAGQPSPGLVFRLTP